MYRRRGLVAALLGVLLLLAPAAPLGGGLFAAAGGALLAAACALRVWARTHIGNHTRGGELACPEVASAGPYKYIKHPLYLSNFLAGAAFALLHAGFSLSALCFCIAYGAFLAALAMKENAFIKGAALGKPAKAPDSGRRSAKQAFASDFPTWFWQFAMLIFVFLRKYIDVPNFFCYI